MKGLALRLSMPDVGAVARSLLGVLWRPVSVCQWGSPARRRLPRAPPPSPVRRRCRTVRAGGPARASGVSCNGRRGAARDGDVGVPPAVRRRRGAVVLLRGYEWAVSANAGLIAAAASALLVTAPPVAPSLAVGGRRRRAGPGRRADAGGVDRGLAAAALAEQREALTGAYRSLAADARRLADGPCAPWSTRHRCCAARGVHPDRESGPPPTARLPGLVRAAGADRGDHRCDRQTAAGRQRRAPAC